MRFIINNLNRLKFDVEVMDEDDRITIVTYPKDEPIQYSRNYTFRVTEREIILVSIIDDEGDIND